MHQNCKFNFSDQVKNNMFWALGSGTAQLTGFDGLWFRHKKRMHFVNFHHQIHRHYFEVNHGTLDVPWDKLFSSFHDGSETGRAKIKDHLKTRTACK